MSDVFVYAILGSATGALIALGSISLVLVYRGSGVVNFAAGGVGVTGAFLYFELHDRSGLPAGPSLLAGVLASALLGWLTHVLMLPLKRASNLTRLVVTLSVLVVITGALGLRFDVANTYSVDGFLPSGPVQLLGVTVGADRLWLIGIAITLTLILMAVYKFTRFGLATSAVSENRDALATLGWSPDRVAGLNWALGGALAGLAAILLAPVLGLWVGMATALLLPSLAAAVVGNLTSFTLCLVGGIGIGIVQAELTRYVSVRGMGDAVPFAIITAGIVLRGRGLPLRSETAEGLPRVTHGFVPARRVLLLSAGMTVLLLFAFPEAWIAPITVSLTAAVVLASIVVITGFAGQISLAQWAIAGTGGLVAAQLLSHGVPLIPSCIIAALAGVPLGVLVGAPSLRARGVSLAIATLGAGVALTSLLLTNDSVNGGAIGLAIGDFQPFGLDMSITTEPRRYAVLVLVMFVLVAVALANLRRGRTGRRMLAVRANERAAASLGINVQGVKLAAFCHGSTIACIGGVLFTVGLPFALFTTYDSFTSIAYVSYAVIGGVGYVAGPLFGGQSQVDGVGSYILDQFGSVDQALLATIFGALTLLVILQAPDGLMPFQANELRKLLRRLGRTPKQRELRYDVADLAASTPLSQPVCLRVEGLTVAFGTERVVDDVTLEVSSGEVLGIIGPNGAGKTTLIDAITGFQRPRGGRVSLGEVDMTRLSTRVRSGMGVARAFQSLELFEDLSVLENVLVASEQTATATWLTDLVHPGTAVLSADAARAIRDLGLEDVLQLLPGELSYGQRRTLAIARAVASRPSVLLLDEPAAGLDERDRTELRAVVVRLAKEMRMAVLLIEHDVDLVSAVSDRMVALDFGRVIATGTPAQVRADPSVLAAYIGADERSTTTR